MTGGDGMMRSIPSIRSIAVTIILQRVSDSFCVERGHFANFDCLIGSESSDNRRSRYTASRR